jgi:ABC-type multidrug transport system fused ATPase/permease subunit
MHWHDSDLELEETKPTGKGGTYIRRLWPFFRRYLGRVIAAGSLLLVSTGLGLLGPVLLKRAIDVNIGQKDLRGLAITSLLYLGIQLFMLISGYYQQVWLALVGERGAADLKQALFRHVLDLPMSFFDKTPAGKLISRVESDTEALKMLFTRTSVVLLQSVLMLLGMSIIMGVASLRLFLLVLVLLPPFVVAFWVFQKKVRPVYIQVRRTVAETNNLVSEVLKSLPVIQVFCQQRRFAQRMDDLNRLKYKGELKATILWHAVWMLVDFGEVLGMGLVLGVGGVWALKGQLTIGTLFLFVSYITRLFGPLRAISDQINVMQRAFASAERTFQVLDQAPEPAGIAVAEPFRLKEAITCENLNFAYDGENLVLKDVSLVVRKGEKVALVGETGGGKTSIVNLLMKFYRAQSGEVRCDAEDLATMDKHRLRSAVGFVPQEVVMFPGSVLDNLRLFDDTIPREQVIEAARRARIHDAITGFPQGYDTVLTEGGANFSLGERQLLAFARALVRDPEILILDEATSSVDPHTEHLIQEGLEELLKGRTAVIVAHRLATIRMADRVLVVHKGRIAEQGTHEELLAREGIYSRLYRLQYVGEAA